MQMGGRGHRMRSEGWKRRHTTLTSETTGKSLVRKIDCGDRRRGLMALLAYFEVVREK